MTEKERNEKIQAIIEEWKKEADKIQEPIRPQNVAILDNGHTGKFYELTQKYQKIIDRLKNS